MVLFVLVLLTALSAGANGGVSEGMPAGRVPVGGGVPCGIAADHGGWYAADSVWVFVRKSTSFQDRVGFRFAWGFNNWGEGLFGNYGKMPGGYSIRTSFSSYQLELAYYPVREKHWCFGVGLGYESDIYRFNNKHVVIGGPDGLGYRTFEVPYANPCLDGKTRLVTRYVNVPLTVKWSPEGNFVMGFTLLPGINYTGKNTGMKYEQESEGERYYVQSSEASVMSMFKCDARLTLGWRCLQIFGQVTTTSITTGMDRKCYPIKFGFVVEI